MHRFIPRSPRRFGALLAAGCCALAATAAGAGDWPQWRGPDRDGFAADGETLGPAWGIDSDPPPTRFTLDGLGAGFASVAVVGDRLYTTGNFEGGQHVVAVDLPADGQEAQIAWTTPITEGVPQHGYEGSRSTPTVAGEFVYVTGSGGSVACLNAGDGSVAWRRDFGDAYGSAGQQWGYAESPLVDGDRVVFTPGADDALLVACDRFTGKELWRADYPETLDGGKREAGYGSAVISEGGGVRQYVMMAGGGTVGVRAEDGEVLWSSPAAANGVAVIPTPLVEGDTVFVSSGYGAGAACFTLSADGDGGADAQLKYELPGRTFQNHHGQMILHEGHVYAGTGHGGKANSPVCVRLSGGEIVWGGGKDRLRGPGKGSAALIAVGDELLFRYQSGELSRVALTPDGYNETGRFTPDFNTNQPSWAHPAVADGVLYVREQGTLLAYDLGRS